MWFILGLCGQQDIFLLQNSSNIAQYGIGDCLWTITTQIDHMIRIIFKKFFIRSGQLTFGSGDEVMKESSIIYVARKPRVPLIIWSNASQIWITLDENFFRRYGYSDTQIILVVEAYTFGKNSRWKLFKHDLKSQKLKTGTKTNLLQYARLHFASIKYLS